MYRTFSFLYIYTQVIACDIAIVIICLRAPPHTFSNAKAPHPLILTDFFFKPNYMTNKECCRNKDHVSKTHVLDMIEETGKEIRDVVDDFIRSQTKDSLQLIFEKQAALLKYLNESRPGNYYNGPERYPFEKVMHMMTAMSDEFSEVRAGIPWKHWKTYDEDESGEDDSCCNVRDPYYNELPDLEATQEQIINNSKLEYLQKEWIDILHFWIQGAQELGLDSKKTLELYLDKNKENHDRQDRGY